MKTREQVLEAIQAGRKSECLDNRDYGRLIEFFPATEWQSLGFTLKEGAVSPTPLDWTHENILTQLTRDVAFGFEKALHKRGISASFMYTTVKMWMWVLDDPLQARPPGTEDDTDYAQYGLPFFKAVAVKYGLPNPIGDDTGTERRYTVNAPTVWDDD